MAGQRRLRVDWAEIVPEATADRVFKRMDAAREALGLSQSEFVRRAGNISPQQYTNWKNGERPSIDQAIALCKAHRLTLEYLYRQDLSGLPASIHDEIAARLTPRRR